jgi:hypothetical protein
MIDWYSLVFNVLWIFSLGLLTAILSYAYYLAGEKKQRFRQVLESPTSRIMIDVALVLFCLGCTGSLAITWERIAFAILALIFLVRTWLDRKISRAER